MRFFYKNTQKRKFRIFRSQNLSECRYLYSSSIIVESPENKIKGIKYLSQIENKAWSVTVGKFLQPVKLNRSGFFFLSINSSLNPLIYSYKMRHVWHAIMEILRNILPHPQQWQKNKKYRTSAIQRLQHIWKLAVVNLKVSCS